MTDTLGPFEETEGPPPTYALTPAHLGALALLVLLVFYTRMLPVGVSVWRDLAAPAPDSLPEPAAGWLSRAAYRAVYEWGAGRADGFLAQQVSGALGLRFLHGLLAVLLGGAALLAYSRRADSVALGVVGLVLLLPAAPLMLGQPGPWLGGPICFLVLLALLARPAPGWLSLAGVPPLMALWAALDPSFVVGLLLLGACAVAFTVDRCSEVGTPGLWAALGPVAVLVASLGVVALVTPDGAGLYASLFEYARRPGLASVPAWMPLDFSGGGTLVGLFFVSLLLVWLTQWVSARGFSPGELLLVFFFALLALSKSGALVWWFLLVPWLLMPRLAEWAEAFPELPRSHRYSIIGALLAVQLMVLAVPLAWLVRRDLGTVSGILAPDVPWPLVLQLRGGERLKEPVVPEVAELLKTSYPQGRFTGTVFATGEAADYLASQLPTDWPVSHWGGPAVASRTRWQQVQGVRSAQADWWEVLADQGVNLIVLHPVRDRPLAEALEKSEGWLIVPVGHHQAALRRKPL